MRGTPRRRRRGPVEVKGEETVLFRVFERVFLPLEIETKTHLFSSSSKKIKTEKALARVAEEVERDLELVGVTAIEDKLADGVPAAVASLVRGGVKVRFYFFPSPVLLGLLTRPDAASMPAHASSAHSTPTASTTASSTLSWPAALPPPADAKSARNL